MNDIQNRRWYRRPYFVLLALFPFSILYFFKIYEELGGFSGCDLGCGLVIPFAIFILSAVGGLIIGSTVFSLLHKTLAYIFAIFVSFALLSAPISFFNKSFEINLIVFSGYLVGMLVGHFLLFLLARHAPWFKEGILKYLVFPATILLLLTTIIFAVTYAGQLFRAHINITFAVHSCRGEIECYEQVAQWFDDKFSEMTCTSEPNDTRKNCLNVLAGKEQSIERCYAYEAQYDREFGLNRCIRTVLYHSEDPRALCSGLDKIGVERGCTPPEDGNPGRNLRRVEEAKEQGFHPGS